MLLTSHSPVHLPTTPSHSPVHPSTRPTAQHRQGKAAELEDRQAQLVTRTQELEEARGGGLGHSEREAGEACLASFHFLTHFLGLDHFSGKYKVQTLFGQSTWEVSFGLGGYSFEMMAIFKQTFAHVIAGKGILEYALDTSAHSCIGTPQPCHQLTWFGAQTPVERLLSSWGLGLFALPC